MRSAKVLCSPGCGPARRGITAVSIAAATLLLLSGSLAGAPGGAPAAGAASECGVLRSDCSPEGVATWSPAVPFVTNVGHTDESVAFYAMTRHGTVFVTTRGEIVYAIAPGSGSAAGSSIAIKETLAGGRRLLPVGTCPSSVAVSRVKSNDAGRPAKRVAAYEIIELGDVSGGVHVTLHSRRNGVEKIFAVAPGADPRDIRISVDGSTGLATDDAGRLVVSTSLGDVRFSRPVAYQHIAGERIEVDAAYAVAGNTYGFSVGSYDPSEELIIDPLLASTYLGGSDAEGGYCADAVALGPDGSVYVTGHTASDDFPTTIGEPYHGGASDVFVSRFDRTLTNLLASTYLGGANEEQASCIAIDAAGNVYVSGGTLSTDFPTTLGAFDRTYGGGTAGPYAVPGDVFVTRLSADLSTLTASTYFGGAGFDYSRAIVTDGTTVYITGATASSELATPGAFDETRTSGGDWGGIDGYVAKFDASLSTLLSATYLGGDGSDYCEDMVAAAAGVYVTGWTQSSDYPFTPTAYDTSFAGGVYDAFVTGLDGSLGSLVGSTYLGGTSWDFGYAIAVDGAGNVYVTGHNAEAGTVTTFPTTPGSFQPEYNGIGGAGIGDDAFVSKFDGTLSTLVASTMFGGTSWEYGTGLKWDADGYICVVGTTTSDDIPRHAGAFQYDYAGDDGSGHSGEGFVSRLTDDLSALDASTFLGGSGNDWPECVVLDEDGNAYVTGSTTSPDFPTIRGSYEEEWQGGDSDAFVSVLSSDLGAIGISATPQCGLPPLVVELAGTAPDAAPTSWAWDVDDDGSIDTTGQNAVWTYDTPGAYSVRLVVSYGSFTPSVVLEDELLVFDESSALGFDGGAARAVCPATPGLNLKGGLTLEAWVNPYDWGGFPFGQMGFGQVLSKGPISLQLVGVHALYNDNSLCLALEHGDGTASMSLAPAGSMVLDEWQHVAATYDTTTSTVRMWIDGVEQAVSHTVAPSGGIADNATADLLLGNIVTLNKGFEGDIDEVSVWNVVREPDDIESGRDYPLFGDEPGLAAYWRMDEACGDTLEDGSGAGNDAARLEAGWVQGVMLYATGVHESGGEDPAGTALLRANHPNPFNPRTTISFALPEACRVEIAIYDAAGRLVRTLVQKHLTRGPHSAVWDGRTDFGTRATSGVYFCRLSTPAGTESSTMVMVR